MENNQQENANIENKANDDPQINRDKPIESGNLPRSEYFSNRD